MQKQPGTRRLQFNILELVVAHVRSGPPFKATYLLMRKRGQPS